MGYRSQIGVLITLPNNVKGEEIVNKFRNAYGEDFEEDFEVDDEESVKGFVFISSLSAIKWYEGVYKEVDAFMNVIRNWENYYSSGGISFLRIGESYDDAEEIYYGEPERYLCMERTMSW